MGNWLSGVDLGVFNTSLPTMALVAYVAYQINGKFNKIEKDLKEMLDLRHFQNLERFAKIEVSLARLGLHNGIYSAREDDLKKISD